MIYTPSPSYQIQIKENLQLNLRKVRKVKIRIIFSKPQKKLSSLFNRCLCKLTI